MDPSFSRRDFIKTSLLGIASISAKKQFLLPSLNKNLFIGAHVWVYSADKPDFDCYDVLDTVFADLKSAGINGVELMERNLRHEGALIKIHHLIHQYNLPVWGASYNGELWDKETAEKTLEDFEMVVDKLSKLKGRLIGISVGQPKGRQKTEKEFDTQAETLQKIIKICTAHQVVPNLHNHTYEVENNCFDLRNTLSRVPAIKLGPDINWLIRAGVDPINFISEFGDKIIYLHLRDQDKNGKWTEALGEGATDFKGIAKALKEKNFSGDITIELAFENNFKPVRSLKNDWKKSREWLVKSGF